MIAPKDILFNQCTISIIECNGKFIDKIVVYIHDADINKEYISITEKGGRGNYWTVSLYSPEYIPSLGIEKMSDDQKGEFIKIINSNWKTITGAFNKACEEFCKDKRFNCTHFCNRSIPETPPDYTQL